MSYPSLSLEVIPFYQPAVYAPSRFDRFLSWCADEDEKHHIGWVGVSILVMTAFFFPITMAAILLNGASYWLMVIAMTALTGVLVINLAALPTRITIPGLFIGIALNILTIALSLY